MAAPEAEVPLGSMAAPEAGAPRGGVLETEGDRKRSCPYRGRKRKRGPAGMASSPSLSPPPPPLALLASQGCEEVRGLERRVRSAIEQKKEELRQLVGERYRDLIEAADAIGHMRRTARGLLRALAHTHRACARRAAPPRPPDRHPDAQARDQFYSLAAQIGLLLEIPERIWSAMEASRYLHATRLLLLCCSLHDLLRLDASAARYSPVLIRFPILVRQAAAAAHFRSTLLHESKQLLRGAAVADQAVAEALCSVMLLEDSSPRQALTDFLLARKAAIQQLLNQPHHGAGIKAQVCAVVELLSTTLYQAHALFYTLPEGQPPDPALPCGLLLSTLETATGRGQAAGKGLGLLKEELKLWSWFRYLPQSVVEFQPTLRTLAHPVSQDYLQDTLQKWVAMCHDDMRVGIGSLLVYVKSLKGLAGIRDGVWELLSGEPMRHSWAALCQRVLSGPLLLWEHLMRQLFLDRLQTLMEEGFAAISTRAEELLAAALREAEAQPAGPWPKAAHSEHDMAPFLWSESPGDLAADAAWISVAHRSQPAPGGLALKARALSPRVQAFCSALDAELAAKLEDLGSYLPAPGPASPPRAGSAFDRYADAGTVEGLLRDQCGGCVRRLLGRVREELRRAEAEPRGGPGAPGGPELPAALFLARLCQSLAEFCPHLKQCMLGTSGGPDRPAREPRPAKKLGKAKVREVDPTQAQWREVKEDLLQQSLAGYRVWTSAVAEGLGRGFTQSLLLDDPGSILAAATSWDEIEIQEETESGSSVTSCIRLPSQPSWPVQTLLFSLCQEVNRVGGQAVPRSTLQELLRGCLTEVLAGFDKLAQGRQSKKDGGFPMTQNRALQLLYDLRYLNTMLTAKTDEPKGSRSKPDPRLEKAIDFLEGHIDPFDLDVFTPHLNSNLSRLVQRTSVLFGLLAGTENQFGVRTGPFNSQEPHNILPLASSQIRFGLLPLSMTSSRKAKSSSRDTEPKTQWQAAAPALARADDDASRPGSLFRQLATEEEDAAPPSLFKLGWLSGMTK
ncbi:conserved oligomeric Golgi complex subunit 1 [Tachyglossus aculeatus]|uniref:conserved oligomeric Golgi complex subunit 1 n=1 Tax=Tachyglossus aculeatus TaxID=9261 RepID=UPI0018F7108D|nr:conserved oligomeric Golgi complex subunit 1 [Tachyglossus aculeatus]